MLALLMKLAFCVQLRNMIISLQDRITSRGRCAEISISGCKQP